MISLEQYVYIIEAENEGKRNKSLMDHDWNYNNYNYPIMILNKLLSKEGYLYLGIEGKKDKLDFDCSKISDKTENELKHLLSNIKNVDENDFNKIMEPYGVRWRKINKGQLTGKTAGQSSGEAAETLVSYLFNEGPSQENIDKWKSSKSDIGQQWYSIASKIVNFLYKYTFAGKKWNNDNFIAVHVDGNDVDKIDDKFTNIAKLFKSKKNASAIIGKNMNNMYSGNKKDKWNPADILLIDKSRIDDIYDSLKGIGDGESLSSYLAKATKEGIIIPISLKATNNPIISMHNILDDEGQDEFTNCTIISGQSYEQGNYNGSNYIIASNGDQQAKIQFRRQTGKNNNLSIEAQIPGNKSARFGKAISSMKFALGIKNDNSYYAKIDSIDDMKKRFKDAGFDIKNIKNDNKIDPPLYKRACFCGMLGMIEIYKKKLGSDYTPEKFFEFCWINSTQCPGSYFIIH